NKVKASSEEGKGEVKNGREKICGSEVYEEGGIVEGKRGNKKRGNGEVSEKVDSGEVNGETGANE
uniref:hypothetical protein n=1 Tax=Staphylococcus aureus TaxID=1280 RepID=UPI001642838F